MRPRTEVSENDLQEARKGMEPIKSHKVGTIRSSLDMPPEVAYGYLGDVARSTGMPLGWSYLSALTIAAGQHSLKMNTQNDIRAQLYTILTGAPNSGKTTAAKRVRETLNPDRFNIESRIPGSEIGLYKFFALPKDVDPPGDPSSALLFQDELEVLMRKMQIEGSTLDGTLRALFYDDISGGASKAGAYFMNTRLSILGGLPCEDPSQFRQIFGSNTGGGFFDRCLIAPPPSESVDVLRWRPTVRQRVPVDVSITDAIAEQFWAWADQAMSPGQANRRRRLQELAQRVAVISASMKGESRLSEKCIRAALELIEWQERTRDKGFRPSKSLNADGSIYEDLIESFMQVTNGEQSWVFFPQLNRMKHWSRAYGPSKMVLVRDALVRLGDLKAKAKDSSKPPKEGNLTGHYMLADHFFAKFREQLNRQIAEVEAENSNSNVVEFPSSHSEGRYDADDLMDSSED